MRRKHFIQHKAMPDRNPFRIGKTYLVLKNVNRQSGYSDRIMWDGYKAPIFIVAKEGDLVFIKKLYNDLTFQVLSCKTTDEVVFDSIQNSFVLSMDDMMEHISKTPHVHKIRVIKKDLHE